MNVDEKIAIARQLERLNVDIIEAGFAASSPGDFEAVRRVADAVTNPTVLSLSRTREEDVDAALRAVDQAKKPGIHIFIATSDIHLKYKLNMTREDVLNAATWAVRRAKKHLDYIEFSCEDASRTDWDYMVMLCTEVIRAGATDYQSAGYHGPCDPRGIWPHVRLHAGKVRGADKVIWSAHCHNDLGLAWPIRWRRYERRAPDRMHDQRHRRARGQHLDGRGGDGDEDAPRFDGREDRVETRQIYPASRLLSQIIGQPVPPNKPIVGDNAFAHEAGIHQDGVLKNKLTYEIMKPEDIGIPSNKLVLGKHSGRHAFINRLSELGVDPTTIDVQKAFAEFKLLCDKKKIVYDDDILALVNEETRGGPAIISSCWI